MDRFFIARNRARAAENRIVFPTEGDMTKFGKPLKDEYADVRPFQDKADLCSRIAKRLHRGKSDKTIVLEAAKLMHLSEATLKRMYDK